MAYDIESSLGCNHFVCVGVCHFFVCQTPLVYVFICTCIGTIHLSDDIPVAVRPCVEGFLRPSGWGQEFSAVLSNDLQSTSIAHP